LVSATWSFIIKYSFQINLPVEVNLDDRSANNFCSGAIFESKVFSNFEYSRSNFECSHLSHCDGL